MKKILLFERLESKEFAGIFTVTVIVPNPVVPVIVTINTAPPPINEPDPGNLPSGNLPVVYPPLPPSGPVGPG